MWDKIAENALDLSHIVPASCRQTYDSKNFRARYDS